MKSTKALIAASFTILISGACMAQSHQKKDNQLTITGITGESIKESADVDHAAKLIDEINSQILKDKLVTEKTGNISYMLNSKQFIINGVLQNQETHLRYKNKYIKENTKWNICKNYKIK